MDPPVNGLEGRCQGTNFMTSYSGATAGGAVEAQEMPKAEDITQSSGSPASCDTWQ